MLPCGVVRSALAELGERGPDPNQLGGMLRSPSLELSKEVSAFLWDVETEREVVGAIQPARAANSEFSRRASETAGTERDGVRACHLQTDRTSSREGNTTSAFVVGFERRGTGTSLQANAPCGCFSRCSTYLMVGSRCGPMSAT